MKTPQGTLVSVVSVAAVVIAADQLTKEIIVREIGPGAARRSIEIIPGFFHFTFVRNTGSAFGLFQGQSAILMVLAMGAIVFLAAYYFRKARHDSLVGIALALQLGGAVGNVIDRIRYGYVVDFLDFPRWPTFNMADSAITVGVVLLMYALLFRDYETNETSSEHHLHSAGEDR
ncbi:signal peptidase II [soil metagenome]